MNKIEILILAQNYPSLDKPHLQSFIHTRLNQYPEHFSITVLSFGSLADYTFEGIKIITEKTFNNNSRKYDVVISHAPNLRNHLRIAIKNIFRFKVLFFVFHGHEIINLLKRVYNQRTIYPFSKHISIKFKLYNYIKLPILKFFLKSISKIKPTHFIFVSKSLLNEAQEDMKDSTFFKIGLNTSIINNPINPIFYTKQLIPDALKADFICIRPFDEPKYGVDIYIDLAKRNSGFTFHLYGMGELPKTDLPKNLVVFNKFLKPKELPPLIASYTAAILPTRWDSQGVLACEIAANGIPLLTSKLKVCEEFLSSFSNVGLVENHLFPSFDLDKVKKLPKNNPQKAFDKDSTVQKEIELIQHHFRLVTFQ
jgi:hypothetical protein